LVLVLLHKSFLVSVQRLWTKQWNKLLHRLMSLVLKL
jgi:hypothetical protein